LKAAQVREETATSDETRMIRILEDSIQRVHQAILKNDIDDLLQAFERVLRYTVKLNLPEHDKVIVGEKQSEAGRVNKGKIKGFAQMLGKICEEVGSTETAGVLKHWQSFDSQADAEKDKAPDVWAVNNDAKKAYWYVDENGKDRTATIEQIKRAMTRHRKRESNSK
jgi:hypothetical protein